MIDWQSFHDGLMPESERRELAARLEQDQALQEEYEGFLAFIKATRSAAQEATPSYEATFALNRRPLRRPLVRAVAGGLALGVVALVGWRLSLDPLTLATTRTQEIVEIDTPALAASWVHDRVEFETPVIDLGQTSRITGARFGQGWACYDYELNGQPIYLYMSPHDSFNRAEKTVRDGQTFYVGRGIGWRTGGLSYYLKGGGETSRWSLAASASRQAALTERG